MEIDASVRSVILDAVASGIVVLDEDARVLVWNRWMVEHSGIPDDIAIGRRLGDVFPELAGTRLDAAIGTALTHRLAALVSPSLHALVLPLYRNRLDRERDSRLWQMIHVAPIRMAGAPACTLHIQDVTAAVLRERRLREQSADLAVRNAELKVQLEAIQELQRQIAEMNARDPLTGVLDAEHIELILEQELGEALANGRPMSVLLFDVDLLKSINDTYHYSAGQAVLKAIGTLLKEALPASAKAGRRDGDAFLVVLPGLAMHEAHDFAEGIRQRLKADKVAWEDTHIEATVSVGVASIPQHGRSAEELMNCLNLAIFLAKHDGYDRVLSVDHTHAGIF